ncbi:hypothetical protein ACKRZS_003359 [Fusarium odoratissimum]
MPSSRPTHSGRDNSGRDAPRRGRPNHGQEKAAPSVPVPDRQAFEAAVKAEVDRKLAELTVNDGSSPMTGVEGSDPQPGPVRGGSRSSRGGFTGRGGRGGSNSGRGRVYHNSHQAGRRSVATSSRQTEDQPLAVATSSMMTWVADSQSRRSARLVNHTPEGGNSHAFFQLRPGHEVWGVTPGYGIEEQARDLKKRSRCSHVIFQLIAVDEERFKAVSKHAVEKTMEDHNGKTVDGRSALLLRGGVDPQPKQEGEDEEEKCKVCGNPDHTLRTCFSRTRKGETFACPQCDTADHSGSTCARIAALPLTEQVKLLITDRGDMPAYYAGSRDDCWWQLMHKFCMSEEFDPTLLGVVPWSKTYPSKLRKDGIDILELQKQHDKNIGFQMPRDSSTESFLKVAQKYWDNYSLPWPVTNLGERPAPPRRHRDGDQNMEETAPVAEPAPAAEQEAAVSTAPDTVAEPATAPAPAPAPAPATAYAALAFPDPEEDEMFGDDGASEVQGDGIEDEIGYSDDDITSK